MLTWKEKYEELIVFQDKGTLIHNLTIKLLLGDFSHCREVHVSYIHHTIGTDSLEGLTLTPRIFMVMLTPRIFILFPPHFLLYLQASGEH